ncbi:hypothetical protein ACTLMP_005265, partial [Escherichia coli]
NKLFEIVGKVTVKSVPLLSLIVHVVSTIFPLNVIVPTLPLLLVSANALYVANPRQVLTRSAIVIFFHFYINP